jgi:hypothetical protein
VEFFEDVVRKDGLEINMNTEPTAETLAEYIEGWRIKLWDQAFGPTLKGGVGFKKSDNFSTYEGSEEAVKRVIFRYVENLIIMTPLIDCISFQIQILVHDYNDYYKIIKFVETSWHNRQSMYCEFLDKPPSRV